MSWLKVPSQHLVHLTSPGHTHRNTHTQSMQVWSYVVVQWHPWHQGTWSDYGSNWCMSLNLYPDDSNAISKQLILQKQLTFLYFIETTAPHISPELFLDFSVWDIAILVNCRHGREHTSAKLCTYNHTHCQSTVWHIKMTMFFMKGYMSSAVLPSLQKVFKMIGYPFNLLNFALGNTTCYWKTGFSRYSINLININNVYIRFQINLML